MAATPCRRYRPAVPLPRQAIGALKNDAVFWVSRKAVRGWNRPDWVSVNLTLKCNLTCSFCTTCYDVPKELSTAEILGIIDQIAAWGVERFNPIGGEPFMRGDLEEILAYACQQDFYVTLTTNGTLISPQRAERIARIPPNRLHFNFSLDGPRAANDEGRGEGSFDKTVAGYRALREADRAAGNALRKVVVNTIITSRNLAELPDFVRWCRDELGAQGVQLLNLFRHGERMSPEARDLWIHPPQFPLLERVLAELIELQRDEGGEAFALMNTLDDLRNIPSYYRDELRPLDGRCYSGWKELYINADGRAIMCDGRLDFLAGSFGDVRRQTLQEMWHGDEIARLRRQVKTCTTPCIQDCYLRSRSDSALRIARGVGGLLLGEAKKRLQQRRLHAPSLPDTVVRVQLSDVQDLQAPWHHAPRRRFEAMGGADDWDEVRRDPFHMYTLRNDGTLDFGRGFLDISLLRELIHDAARSSLTWGTLRLGWEGEPLLHPQIEEILPWLHERWAEHRFAQRIELHTHGALINDNVARLSVGEAPLRWLIVVDHWDAASSLEVHGEDIHARILDSLRTLGRALTAAPELRVQIVLQHRVTPHSAPHLDRLRDTWLTALGDAGLPATAAGIELPASGHALQVIPAAQAAPQGPCAAYWLTPTITWEGKVLLCPADHQHRVKVGSLDARPLSETWWFSSAMERVRSRGAANDLGALPVCRDCAVCAAPDFPRVSDASRSPLQRFGYPQD